MVVIGSIIGSGIFKKIAPMTLKLQSESLVLTCWLIAGVITLFGALTYAEIGARMPATGGLYAYLHDVYGKSVGFFFGWACFAVIQSASISSIAYVFAEATKSIFQVYGVETKVLAAATIFLLTAVNCLGLIFGAWVENIFTSLKILGIAIVAILAFMVSHNPDIAVAPTMQALPIDVPHGLALVPAMFSAMVGAFWAYDGMNNIGFIGGEIKNANRNLPRALIFGVSGILVIYLVVNYSYFHALSLDQILAIARNPEKIFAIEMLQQTHGVRWSLFASILIMVATFGATNGSILTSARIYYAMARDGLFFKDMGTATRKQHTPVTALVWQGLWAMTLIFMGTFEDLTDMTIFAAFIFYGLGAFGLFLLRKKQRENHTGYRVFSFVPFIYILFCATLVIVTIYQDPVGAAKGLLLIAAGIPLYLWFMKRSKFVDQAQPSDQRRAL